MKINNTINAGIVDQSGADKEMFNASQINSVPVSKQTLYDNYTLIYDEINEEWKFKLEDDELIESSQLENFSGTENIVTLGTITTGSWNANIIPIEYGGTGNTTGSAASLTTARNIGGVSFDGSTDIDLPGVNTMGNQSTTGNASTASKLQTARNIGGVSFDGSADIDLPGVNIQGTQDTTGNAESASKLQTARNIGGVSFDGTADIDLPGVNTTGNQDTTGNAASATKILSIENDNIVQLTSEQTLSNKTLTSLNGITINSEKEVNIGNNRIQNVSDPIDIQDAATKSYVDTVAEGLHIQESCRLATTENITLSGTQTIDGIETIEGDRILVKDQEDKTENGVYDVSSEGGWTRSSDFDEPNEIKAGDFVFVTDGILNGSHGYVMTQTSEVIVGGTDITWTQFSGAGQIEGGDGISKNGNELSVDLKSEGGLMIESTKLGLDLGNNSITGVLGISNGGTGVSLLGTTEQILKVNSEGNGLEWGNIPVVKSFEKISINGQDDVVADSSSDTLTLVAGSGMTITSDSLGGNTITFSRGGDFEEINVDDINIDGHTIKNDTGDIEIISTNPDIGGTGTGIIKLNDNVTISNGELYVDNDNYNQKINLFSTNHGVGIDKDGLIYIRGNSGFKIFKGGSHVKGDYSTGEEIFKIDIDGNVGIGINPTSKLHVNGTTNITGDTNIGGTLDVTGATNINNTTTSTSTTTGALIVDGGVGIAENTNIGGVLNVGNNFRLENNGKRLKIQHGEIYGDDLSGLTFYTGNQNNNSSLVLNNDKSARFYGDVTIESPVTADTTLTIKADDSRTASLNLYGETSQGTGRVFVGQSILHGGGFLYSGDSTPSTIYSDDTITFFRRDNGTESKVFQYSYGSDHVNFFGNVHLESDKTIQVGTTNTTTSLEIHPGSNIGSGRIGYAFIGYAGVNADAGFGHINYIGNASSCALRQTSTGATVLSSVSGQDLFFRIAGSDKMRISSSGNVGIGTTDPDEKLEVNGNILADNVFSNNTKNNLMDTDIWRTQSSGTITDSIGKYTLNQTTSGENSMRVNDIGPFGDYDYVWEATSLDTTNNADGGWNYYIYNVNSKFGYMSVVYFKVVNNSDGSFYHGCHDCLNIDGTIQYNPYFVSGSNVTNYTLNEWYVSVGVILPYKSGGYSSPSTIGGIYHLSTGYKVRTHTNFMMEENSTIQRHRAYLYYSTSIGSKIYFTRPGFYKINGTEPTLTESLGGNVIPELTSSKINLTPNKKIIADSIDISNTTSTSITSNIVLLEIFANTTSTVTSRKYAGSIDIEILGKRSVSYYSENILTTKLHFSLSWNAQNQTFSNNKFILEHKTVSDGTYDTYTLLQGIPEFKYKYDNSTKKYHIYVAITHKQSYINISYSSNVSSVNVEDIYIPSSHTLMSTGTSYDIEPSICYDNAGNVGIGTTNPTEKLEVYPNTNNSAIIGTAHIGYVGHSDYAAFSHFDQVGTTSYALQQSATGNTFLNSQSGRNIYFRSNNVDKMILSGSTGNVGIGTTSPQTLLHISSYAVPHKVVENFTTLLIESAEARLQIISPNSSSAGSLIALSNAGSSGGIQKNWVFHHFGPTVDNKLGIYYKTNDSLNTDTLYVNSNVGLTLDTSGNVGIGTTDPDQKLEVNGNIKVDGDAYIKGNLKINNLNFCKIMYIGSTVISDYQSGSGTIGTPDTTIISTGYDDNNYKFGHVGHFNPDPSNYTIGYYLTSNVWTDSGQDVFYYYNDVELVKGRSWAQNVNMFRKQVESGIWHSWNQFPELSAYGFAPLGSTFKTVCAASFNYVNVTIHTVLIHKTYMDYPKVNGIINTYKTDSYQYTNNDGDINYNMFSTLAS